MSSDKLEQYDVHFSDGTVKSFEVGCVVDAWIRAMSYAIVTNREIEVKHIVNHRSMHVFSDFDWDITFSLKDKSYITGSPIRYTEGEAEEMFVRYVKYLGNSLAYALDWFARNKKKK